MVALKPRLLRDSSLYFAGNFISRAVSLLMIPFYARHLSTAEYGVLNLVELATTITAILFGLQSIGQALTRVYYDERNPAARLGVVSTALLAAVAGAVLVAAAASLCARPIAQAINLPEQVGLLRAGFAAMAFATVVEFLLLYQRMCGRARFYLAYSMAQLAGSVSFNVWFIGVLGFGVWGFVCSKLVVTAAGSLFLLAVVLRDVWVLPSLRQAVALARFGAPLALSGVCYFVIHFSDRLFLARVSRADVGVYSLAYTFAMLLSVLVGDSFAKSWNVSFYRFAEDDGWQDRFARVGGWLVFVLAVGAMGISLFGRDLIRVMAPSSYVPPAWLLPVLVVGYFCREIGDFFRNMLLIDIGAGLVGRIALAGAVLNLVLNAVLIGGPLGLGIWGAAIATCVTWAVYAVACWVAAQRVHRVRPVVWPLARLLALAAFILLAHGAVSPADRFTTLGADAGWCCIFLIGSLFLYLNQAQREDLARLARRTWDGILSPLRRRGEFSMPSFRDNVRTEGRLGTTDEHR